MGPKYKQGDIVLAKFPFSEKNEYKKRPVLIISNDTVNSIYNSYLCIKITSRIKNIPEISILLNNKELSVPLEKTSELRLMEITYILENMIERKISELTYKAFKKVRKQLINYKIIYPTCKEIIFYNQ